eukprot:CAMPEP_0170746054 /NCGR_PEP_ID=MMETSP0437-20130122/8612_1 /TAXON_ID=0 /ORGANISM="Sexangularia sp." /LENGTH=152 /DNA_ID=CAMNT_0011084795 /DNA_START=114 /DNA_END=575 /DNA_ORIENTATION=+
MSAALSALKGHCRGRLVLRDNQAGHDDATDGTSSATTNGELAVQTAESALVRQAEREAAARQQAAEEAIRDINAQTLEEQRRLTLEAVATPRRLDRARSESERERAAADLSRAEKARAPVQRMLRPAKRGGEKVRKLVARRHPQPQEKDMMN